MEAGQLLRSITSVEFAASASNPKKHAHKKVSTGFDAWMVPSLKPIECQFIFHFPLQTRMQNFLNQVYESKQL
jgi:hypothetical protein